MPTDTKTNDDIEFDFEPSISSAPDITPKTTIIEMKLGKDNLPIKPLKSNPDTIKFGGAEGLPKIEHPLFRITNDADVPKTYEICYIKELQTSFTATLEPHESRKFEIIIKPGPKE